MFLWRPLDSSAKRSSILKQRDSSLLEPDSKTRRSAESTSSNSTITGVGVIVFVLLLPH